MTWLTHLQAWRQTYANAIGAQLKHFQTGEVAQVGDVADFVVKQKKFLQPSQLLQTFHLPQNVEGHVELPVVDPPQKKINRFSQGSPWVLLYGLSKHVTKMYV